MEIAERFHCDVPVTSHVLRGVVGIKVSGSTSYADAGGGWDSHGDAGDHILKWVTVNPSSELINATGKAKASAVQMRGMLNVNGPGSTGRSSPDAAAPSPKATGGGG